MFIFGVILKRNYRQKEVKCTRKVPYYVSSNPFHPLKLSLLNFGLPK